MDVIGIDFGNDSCVVSLLHNNRIEIVLNDYHERKTVSCVAFTDSNQEIGVAAANQLLTNIPNTFYHFKHELNKELKVNVKNLTKTFETTQILAMLFSRLKSFANASVGRQDEVVKCVITCPTYFKASEREIILVAAGIAGLSCISLIKDTTAIAISYGVYKTFPKPVNVVFIDFGHSFLQVCICSFSSNKTVVLADVSAPIGGRDVDKKIAEYFISKLDLLKASIINEYFYRGLLIEVEKLKKKLGLDTESQSVNIGFLLRKESLQLSMDRKEMETVCVDIFEKVKLTMIESLEKSSLTPEDIQSVETVGGSRCIPKVKSLVQDVFGKPARITMNQDEAIAKGCLLNFLSKKKIDVEGTQESSTDDIIEEENIGPESMQIKEIHPEFRDGKETFLSIKRSQLDDFKKMVNELEARDRTENERRCARNTLDEYCNSIRKPEVLSRLEQHTRDELTSELKTIKHWIEGTTEQYTAKRKRLEELFIDNSSNKKKKETEPDELSQKSNEEFVAITMGSPATPAVEPFEDPKMLQISPPSTKQLPTNITQRRGALKDKNSYNELEHVLSDNDKSFLKLYEKVQSTASTFLSINKLKMNGLPTLSRNGSLNMKLLKHLSPTLEDLLYHCYKSLVDCGSKIDPDLIEKVDLELSELCYNAEILVEQQQEMVLRKNGKT